jgi:hypothetical protein
LPDLRERMAAEKAVLPNVVRETIALCTPNNPALQKLEHKFVAIQRPGGKRETAMVS